jgi:aspartyl/asparaginyl-tRNA synthetase
MVNNIARVFRADNVASSRHSEKYWNADAETTPIFYHDVKQFDVIWSAGIQDR